MIDKDAALWFPKEQQRAEIISGLSCVLGPGQMENLRLRCVSGRWVSTWKQVEIVERVVAKLDDCSETTTAPAK